MSIKNIATAGYLALITFFGNHLSANEQFLRSENYIMPPQLRLYDESLFVEIKGELYHVTQLTHNEEGYSVTAFPVHEWSCAKGHLNWPWRENCYVCGLPPDRQ